MFTYLSAVLSGSADPFLPHVVLLGASVLGTVFVATGIIRKSPGWSVAKSLVVIGVLIETLATFGLFIVDEEISSAQNRVIAQLKSQRQLTELQKQRIADVAKRFPSLSFLAVTNPEAEPWNLALEISGELNKGGWNWLPWRGGLQPLDGRPAESETIADDIEIHVHPGNETVGHALADAIREPGVFGMEDVRVVPADEVGALVLVVGSKL